MQVGRFCRLDELHSSGLLRRSCSSGGGISGGIGFCRRLGLAKVKLAVTVGINRVTIRVILAHTIREILIVRDRHVDDLLGRRCRRCLCLCRCRCLCLGGCVRRIGAPHLRCIGGRLSSRRLCRRCYLGLGRRLGYRHLSHGLERRLSIPVYTRSCLQLCCILCSLLCRQLKGRSVRRSLSPWGLWSPARWRALESLESLEGVGELRELGELWSFPRLCCLPHP